MITPLTLLVTQVLAAGPVLFCMQSMADSDGFFCDTEHRWNLRKNLALEQFQRNTAHMTYTGVGSAYYQQVGGG